MQFFPLDVDYTMYMVSALFLKEQLSVNVLWFRKLC